MSYTKEMLASMEKVAANRAANAALEPRRMTAEEKDTLLETYHPDYRKDQFREIVVGPNKGEKAPIELTELLEANSRIKATDVDLSRVDYDVDVLVIGGGGAGSSAAIEAHEAGANVMIVTKLRIGDANTMMAEGGIQAADKPNDSPAIHYVDAFGGGHFAAKPELVSKLVCDAPEAIQWLSDLGVEFDKAPDGTMITTHGGGTSRKRMHAAKDYSGAEIMRTLRDEVLNRGIPVVDFTAAIELIKDDKGAVAGAVLMNMETKELLVARAKTVIIAPVARADCTIRASRPPTTMARRPTVWCWDTGSAQNCFMRIRSSITPPARLIRNRFSARWLRKRFVRSAPSWLMWTARCSCTRWRPATFAPPALSVSAMRAERAFQPEAALACGWIPR